MMKRITCLAIALLLVLTSSAFAGAPSRTTGGMTNVTVATPAQANVNITPVDPSEAAYEQLLALSAAELAKLQAVGAAAYFGDVVNFEELLGTATPNVHEFIPLKMEGLNNLSDPLTLRVEFATPYEKGEKLVVMLGLVSFPESGEPSIEWTAHKGVSLGQVDGVEEGSSVVEVEVDAATLKAIQNGMTVLAVVSK